MAGLEGGTHDVDVTRAVEGVVAAAVGHLDELVDDGLVLQLGRVDEVGGTELLGPLLLAGVDIDDDDLAGLVDDGALDNGQTDAAGAEDGDVVTLLDVGGDAGGAVAGGDAAAEQAGAVHGGILLDGDDGDVGDDGVLGEGGGAHEVQQVLALALEARGAVGHDALALGGANLAAQVGLARLAELALLALGGVEGDDVVAGLHVGDALADGLDDTGTLVTEDDGEGTLGVLAGESVGIWNVSIQHPFASLSSQAYMQLGCRAEGLSEAVPKPLRCTQEEGFTGELTCVADTGVVDFDTDLVGLGRGDFDLLDAQGLTGLPGDSSLASNGLFSKALGQRRVRDEVKWLRRGVERASAVELPRNR